MSSDRHDGASVSRAASRARLRLLAAAVCVAGAASVARAQTVRGTARAAIVGGEAAPASDASIVLVDSAGRIVAGSITDASGHFALRAPAAATYRVLARRVGFSPDSSSLLALRDGETVAFDPVLRAFAVQLATVRVDAAQRCRIAPEAGALAQQLWEDAQSALTATVIGGSDAGTSFLLRRFERELDPDGETMRSARTWDAVTNNSEPYSSIAAESLAVHGFVVPQGSSLVYYAPDARTLISDAFARGHCFRAVEQSDHPQQIGLAFAPVVRAARGRRDVSGALWLDRDTGKLLDLEVTYAVPQEFGSATVPVATARVEYGRTESGRWIVQHWVLRMPVVAARSVMAPRDGAPLQMGAVLARETVPTVTAIWEAGGDVVRTLAGADTAIDAVGIVQGRFVDTIADAHGGAPHLAGVSGIRVALGALGGTVADARYMAVSDSTGSFAIGRVRPGRYVVLATGDVLDTLTITVPPREITVAAATSQTLTTTLPSAEAVLRSLCPDGVAADEAVVHGLVRDEDGRAIGRAKVVVSWVDVADQRDSHFVGRARTLGSVTDRNGAYAVCGVPRGRPLTVRATRGATESSVATLDQSWVPTRMALLQMPRESH